MGLTANRGKAQEAKPDLSNLSLDSLASMEIVSVAKKSQKLNDAAAAIFVITSEDIRRSGLNNLAELLRTAPGLDVAQIDANKWAITTRGFNERFADRTLFLMDGRAIYSPLTSGVSWDVQETVLEDIDRIEIIRGPGATLWGANAMDGVVNIITKKARDTQGLLVIGSTSIEDRASGTVRFGGAIGSRGHYRLYAKYLDDAGHEQRGDQPAADAWQDLRAGFRSDWDLPTDSTLSVQGTLYRARSGETTLGIVSLGNPLGAPFDDKTHSSGGDFSARWTKTSTSITTSVQAYFDLTHRDELGEYGEYRHTIDIGMDQQVHSSIRNNLSWGADFRFNADNTVGSFSVAFNPARRNLQFYGAYIQDEIGIVPEKLKLTAGGKFEHSYFNGFVFQPNVRLIWTPDSRYSVWTSVARAAASPSRIDADVRFNEAIVTDTQGAVTLFSHFGTNHLPPETVIAYELGARAVVSRKVSIDVAAFYNLYSKFHTNESGTPFMETGGPLPTHLVVPDSVQSNSSAMSRGGELLLEAHPASFWKLTASYAALLIEVNQSAASLNTTNPGDSEGSTPRNQAQVHSLLSLPHKFEFDSSAFYVGKLTQFGIKPYTRLDIRAGWRPTSQFEISVGGKNLLQSQHYEFGSGDIAQAAPIWRSAYLKATWSFQ
jgi:iron complex outermembrane receptor protein